MWKHLLAAGSLAGSLLAATAATATTYATRADFDQAFITTVTDDFSGYAVGFRHSVAGGLVNVSSEGGVPNAFVHDYSPTFGNALTGSNGVGISSGKAVTLTFTSPVYGFAFDDLDLIGAPIEAARATIALSDGTAQVFTIKDPDFNFETAAFFGFGSDVAITSVRIRSFFNTRERAANFIDNLTVSTFRARPSVIEEPVGGSGAVPEPATWAMMIAGFGGVGAMMRRRRLSQA